jgi:hypothetical protein
LQGLDYIPIDAGNFDLSGKQKFSHPTAEIKNSDRVKLLYCRQDTFNCRIRFVADFFGIDGGSESSLQ